MGWGRNKGREKRCKIAGSKKNERKKKRVEKGQENECCLCPRTCFISVCTTIAPYLQTPTARGREKKPDPHGCPDAVTVRITLIYICSREVLHGKPRRLM